jgi:hypothetical protein
MDNGKKMVKKDKQLVNWLDTGSSSIGEIIAHMFYEGKGIGDWGLGIGRWTVVGPDPRAVGA